jgi:hypothetical protein
VTQIEYNLPDYDYHDKEIFPHISSSDVKTVLSKSLLHWAGQERKESIAFDIGKAVHAMILEPEKDLVVRGPEDRRGSKWKDAKAKAEKDGKVLLTEKDFDTCMAMATNAFMHCDFLKETVYSPQFVAEASIFTTCSKTGVDVKVRPDGLIMPSTEGGAPYIIDVKTTTDASPEGFHKEIRRYNYDVQIAFYLHAMQEAGLPCKTMYLIAVEKNAPYVTTVHELSELHLKHAEKRMLATLEKIGNAMRTGEFTTDWPDVNQVFLPAWMEDQIEAF